MVTPLPHPLADGGWQRYVGCVLEKQYSSNETVSGAMQKKSVWYLCSLSMGWPRTARASLMRWSQSWKVAPGIQS